LTATIELLHFALASKTLLPSVKPDTISPFFFLRFCQGSQGRQQIYFLYANPLFLRSSTETYFFFGFILGLFPAALNRTSRNP